MDRAWPVAFAFVAWWAARHVGTRRRSGSALSAQEQVERVESEHTGGRRSGQHAPITIRGGLADDIETKILPLPPEIRSLEPEDQARNLLVLQRIAASVKRI